MQATERAAVSTTSSQKGVVTPKRSPAHTSSHCPPSPPPALRFYACVRAKSLQSCPLSATLGTVALQAPLSVGFSRQDCCSGLPCPPPGGLPNPGTEPRLLCLLHRPRAPPGPPSVPRDLFIWTLLINGTRVLWSTSSSSTCTSSRSIRVGAASALPLSRKLKPTPLFVIPSSWDGRWGGSHVLAIVSHASVNVRVQSCAWRDSQLSCWTLGSLVPGETLRSLAGHLEALEIPLEGN